MHRILRKLVVGCLPLIALCHGTVAEANIVANGGFETGDFSGWTSAGDNAFDTVFDGAPRSGTYAASLGAPTTTSTLSQTLTTVAGSTYTLQFWLMTEADPNGAATPNSFAVAWAGTTRLMLTNLAASGYTLYTITDLVAATTSTVLRFTDSNKPAFFDLDDVAVDLAAPRVVPEPDALALLALAGSLMVIRRRRR